MSDLWILSTGSTADEERTFRKEAKVQAASLVRSAFDGVALIFHGGKDPFFRIERKQIVEPDRLGEESGLFERLKPYLEDGRQWVVFSRSGNLVLRNVDHLLPADLPGPFSPERVDFYYPGKWGVRGPSSDGLWAVRVEFLEKVLQGWEGLPVKCAERLLAWNEFLARLDLRTRAFEQGEVLVPEVGGMNWKDVSDAAFLVLSHWPEGLRWKLLQGLYFGTYFGDDSGLMLEILDS